MDSQVFYIFFMKNGKESGGQKPFSINTKLVLAFREIGQGYESINKFATVMNMPPA